MRILIVDDDPSHRLLLATYLASYGEIEERADGRAAVAAYEESLAGSEPFRLVFMDIMMPEVDGQEALRRIRSAEDRAGLRAWEGSLVFMTTALDDAESIWRAHFEGHASGYFIKPLRKAAIVKRLAQLDIHPLD